MKPENPWNLTPRQCEVFGLMTSSGRGASKETARILGVTPKAVEVQVCQALKRMGAATRLEAALMWDRWARGQ